MIDNFMVGIRYNSLEDLKGQALAWCNKVNGNASMPQPTSSPFLGVFFHFIIGTDIQQTVSLVLNTIRLAMKAEKKRVAAELQFHSDQGFHYTSQGYFNLTQEYGVIPSMSRRGTCYDNAMAENFVSILKTECIYRQKIRTFQQARKLIDDFTYFYNHERIRLKTGETPLTRRLSA